MTATSAISASLCSLLHGLGTRTLNKGCTQGCQVLLQSLATDQIGRVRSRWPAQLKQKVQHLNGRRLRITMDTALKFSDMLSTIGGTMGLFTGFFSIISAIEIIYFLGKFLLQHVKKRACPAK